MASRLVDAIFGLAVFAIGVLNLVLVHRVPGVAGLLLSLAYLPPARAALRQRFGISVPLAARILLGLAVVWFTLGVSDLGDLVD